MSYRIQYGARTLDTVELRTFAAKRARKILDEGGLIGPLEVVDDRTNRVVATVTRSDPTPTEV